MRCDADAAGERQFEAASERRAADLAHHHGRKGLDAGEQALELGHVAHHGVRAVGAGEERADVVEIHAGAEDLP